MSWRKLWNRWFEAPSSSPSAAPTLVHPGEMRKFSATELAQYKGEDGATIYVSVKNKVYDCTSGAAFYGPGKSYAVFAGKEVSRCLGKMMISDEEANTNWDDLSTEHMQTLEEWVAKFESKYPVVGEFEPDEEYYARQKQFAP